MPRRKRNRKKSNVKLYKREQRKKKKKIQFLPPKVPLTIWLETDASSTNEPLWSLDDPSTQESSRKASGSIIHSHQATSVPLLTFEPSPYVPKAYRIQRMFYCTDHTKTPKRTPTRFYLPPRKTSLALITLNVCVFAQCTDLLYPTCNQRSCHS